MHLTRRVRLGPRAAATSGESIQVNGVFPKLCGAWVDGDALRSISGHMRIRSEWAPGPNVRILGAEREKSPATTEQRGSEDDT